MRVLATLLLAERHNLWYSTHNPLKSTYTHTLTTYKAWVVIAGMAASLVLMAARSATAAGLDAAEEDLSWDGTVTTLVYLSRIYDT